MLLDVLEDLGVEELKVVEEAFWNESRSAQEQWAEWIEALILL